MKLTLGRLIAGTFFAYGIFKIGIIVLDWIGRLFDLAQLQELVGKLPAPLALPYELVLLTLGPIGAAYLAWDLMGRPPVRNWLVGQGPNSGETARMRLTDLAVIAERDHDWKFGNDSYESLDFIRAVKQAHIDGALDLDGRLGCEGKEEDAAMWHPLVDIPRNHLSRPNWEIEVPYNFKGTRNFDISTYRMGGTSDERYRDLYVRNKAKALEWLKTEAHLYRGDTERLETKRSERVAEWKDLQPFNASDHGEGDIGLTALFTYLMEKAVAFRSIADVSERHDKIDVALRDALGKGRLLSYGRPAGDFIDHMFDHLSTMRIIETAFWANGAEIQWATIDDTAPLHKRCLVQSRDGLTSYYDLQFDTAQIKKLWPA